MKKRLLAGLWTALITPFKKDKSVDYDLFEVLVEEQAEAKNDILVLGTTGETPTLSKEEKINLVRSAIKVLERFPEDIKLMVGISDFNTKEVVEFGQLLMKAEFKRINAFLVSTPWYNKPCQEGLYQHFTTIASALDKPIMLYNVPARTGVNIKPMLVKEIAVRYSNVLGIKEAYGTLDQISELMEISDRLKNFSVLIGDDVLYYYAVRDWKIHGCVSVVANLIPEVWAHFSDDFLNRSFDWVDKFNDIKPSLTEMMSCGNPKGIKALMSELGSFPIENVLRLPLVPLLGDEKEVLLEIGKKFKILAR